ncbi:hypothetical protein ACMFMF_002385 [Clarireedia jacksonii]
MLMESLKVLVCIRRDEKDICNKYFFPRISRTISSMNLKLYRHRMEYNHLLRWMSGTFEQRDWLGPIPNRSKYLHKSEKQLRLVRGHMSHLSTTIGLPSLHKGYHFGYIVEFFTPPF